MIRVWRETKIFLSVNILFAYIRIHDRFALMLTETRLYFFIFKRRDEILITVEGTADLIQSGFSVVWKWKYLNPLQLFQKSKKMIFLPCSADRQLWYQPAGFSLGFTDFGKLISATGTWTMFKRLCSSLGFLISLHHSLLTPHPNTAKPPQKNLKIETPQFPTTAQSFYFAAHFICGLVSRPRKTPHAIKPFNFTFKPFKFIILALGTASLVWYHHFSSRGAPKWSPKSETRVSSTFRQEIQEQKPQSWRKVLFYL